MLITGENASSLFNPYTRTIKPLPSTIGDKPTLFNPALHPQSDLVVGHCLDSLGVLKRKISDDCNGIPEGKTITSIFALNSEGELLFEPVPLFLFFSGKDKLVGYNRMKSLFLLDRKGEILHEYEKCFRYRGENSFFRKINLSLLGKAI